MRTMVSTIIGLALLCGAPAVVAEDLPEPADEGRRVAAVVAGLDGSRADEAVTA